MKEMLILLVLLWSFLMSFKIKFILLVSPDLSGLPVFSISGVSVALSHSLWQAIALCSVHESHKKA